MNEIFVFYRYLFAIFDVASSLRHSLNFKFIEYQSKSHLIRSKPKPSSHLFYTRTIGILKKNVQIEHSRITDERLHKRKSKATIAISLYVTVQAPRKI